MFFDKAMNVGTGAARLAFVALIGAAVGGTLGEMAGCHARVVVGTEPSEEPAVTPPGAVDAGHADGPRPEPDDAESDEDDDDADDDDDDDADDDALDEDVEDDTTDSGEDD